MGLTISMRLYDTVKDRDAVFVKLGDILFTSLTMLGLDLKVSNNSTIKENLILSCRKFSALIITTII